MSLTVLLNSIWVISGFDDKNIFTHEINVLRMIKYLFFITFHKTFHLTFFFFFYFILKRWIFKWNYRIIQNIWPIAVSNKDSSCYKTMFDRKSLLLGVKDQQLLTSINYTQCTWWRSNNKQKKKQLIIFLNVSIKFYK